MGVLETWRSSSGETFEVGREDDPHLSTDEIIRDRRFIRFDQYPFLAGPNAGMDDIDIDMLMEIPDTPDRASGRQINRVQLGRASGSSSVRNPDLMNIERFNQLDIRSRVAHENVHQGRTHLHPPRRPIIIDDLEQSGKHTTSRTNNSHPFEDASLFRRAARVDNSRPETRQPSGATRMDKGKDLCGKVPSKPPVSREKRTTMRSVDQSEHEYDHIFDMASPRGTSRSLPSQGRCKGQISIAGAPSRSPVSSRTIHNASKGKEKIDVGTFNGSCAALNRGKAIDLSSCSQHEVSTNLSTSHQNITPPRVTGRKRLVRNGCISPHNIANEAQRQIQRSISVETSQPQKVASSGPSDVDIKDIVTADNNFVEIMRVHNSTRNGHVRAASPAHNDYSSFLEMKRVPHSTRNERPPVACHASISSQASGDGVANKDGEVNRDGSLAGWRNTRNRDAMQRAPTGVSATGRINIPQVIGSKRLRKHGNHGESSSSTYDDPEILCLGSSQRSSRLQNREPDSSIRRNEISLETRTQNTQESGSVVADESQARTRQVEADEILARELQEQLYCEMPVYGTGEIDQSIAWDLALQQEENVFPGASTHNHPALRIGRGTQPRPQAQAPRNPPNRRGTQTRNPISRVSQLRNRFNRSTTAAPRRRTRIPVALFGERNLQFPPDMDLDMRLNILEAMEAAVGDLDYGASHLLNLQRDFNENDYEMLLALDDNNSQQGASVHQINSLPEYVLQVANEVCFVFYSFHSPTTLRETVQSVLKLPQLVKPFVIFHACINFTKIVLIHGLAETNHAQSANLPSHDRHDVDLSGAVFSLTHAGEYLFSGKLVGRGGLSR
ncbi:unnamed protein product [Linum tenue]|uniref:Uncharacterized protein n=1 Tax=Linum tenue TaxID=586396 RepID=A0AAV0LUF1_9ROSI|nr:unnamed protein product [Linum tenue]